MEAGDLKGKLRSGIRFNYGYLLRAKSFYVRKNSNNRHAYTLEQLAAKYQMGILQNELWEIINRDYETFEVEADWNKEFPKSDEIKWED